jgi:hypothetical protein
MEPVEGFNKNNEEIKIITLKNTVFGNAMPCDSSNNRRFAGNIASIISVERIIELGTTLPVCN